MTTRRTVQAVLSFRRVNLTSATGETYERGDLLMLASQLGLPLPGDDLATALADVLSAPEPW
jgi:hypothetical protein